MSRIQHAFDYLAYNYGPLEGSVNKIKVIKRIACGYRNFFNLEYRIMINFNVIQRGSFT
ncbi:transposase [Vagococcus fessus]|uniref:Transposase IS204/IS1001/IS1096/IS1165 DDE domain-containing protein n=1 Tax=Vagococcus fessus TaxID=120370 RepID=A0A430ABD1_9ENTE|nr:transposase [Vagococcus fessus]RSU04522.1 hypothetical protein CBF31_00440 [Vagococcus fessus]